MPVHDWTRVDAGTFHAFHTSWISDLMEALNAGLLPKGYYALSEQVATRMQTDVLTLPAPTRNLPRGDPVTGGVAVAERHPTSSSACAPIPSASRAAPRSAAGTWSFATSVVIRSSLWSRSSHPRTRTARHTSATWPERSSAPWKRVSTSC